MYSTEHFTVAEVRALAAREGWILRKVRRPLGLYYLTDAASNALVYPAGDSFAGAELCEVHSFLMQLVD